MNELQIARLLTELGTEVAIASEHAAQAARLSAQAIQTLQAVNLRIQGVVNRLLIEEADVVSSVAATAVPEAVSSSPIVAEHSSAPEPASTEDPTQEEPPAAPQQDHSPLVRPEIYDDVLNRFAASGYSTSILAEEFGVRVGIISKCLLTARQTSDARVATGDLKRTDSVERDAGKPFPVGAGCGALPTIEPKPDDVGNPLATVAYTDGTASRSDNGDHVRMKGPGLRVVALLKDQRFYPLAEVIKASRHVSEAVFRSAMIDIQRSLAQIGLHIVEIPDMGLQLRKLECKQDRTRSAS